MPKSDWDIAEGLDPDGPSAADLDRFGDEMILCPSCGRKIYDQAELCPHCGHAMEAEAGRFPFWMVAMVLLLAGLMVYWMI